MSGRSVEVPPPIVPSEYMHARVPPSKPRRSAVILAGGKSSRFGQDKGLAVLQGKRLVCWVVDKLLPMVDETVVSLSGEKQELLYRKAVPSPVRFIEDDYFELGPLGGLISAFEQLKCDYIAVAPCDAPFIKPALYELLFELAEGTDGAVPFFGGHYEPLHAVYNRDRMLPAMKKMLGGGRKKLTEAYPHLEIVEVDERRIRRIDPELESFLNLNTPLDMGRAKSKKNCDYGRFHDEAHTGRFSSGLTSEEGPQYEDGDIP